MGSNNQLRWCGERLAVSAATPPVLLFGSRVDGMWRSPDGGKTWAKVRMHIETRCTVPLVSWQARDRSSCRQACAGWASAVTAVACA
jgi:hypothetical protein